MPFDVFALRESVVGEYRDYFESFVNILDPRVEGFVRKELAEGRPWPDAVLQLNPAFEQGERLHSLATAGTILDSTAKFFGPDLHLYTHQQQAVEIGLRGEPYVVTSGTGSGKSLTYLVPIVDHVLRNQPERQSVRAIIVYPTNALINSQLNALYAFKNNWPGCPLTFEQYTGQQKEAEKEKVRQNPPHILLTNYVMLEYLLIRPTDRSLVEQATRDLRFLVLDEMHIYRGRQGADVAMLARRVRQRAGHGLQVVGTSATLASGGPRDQRLETIATVASSLFGTTVPPANVVDETLRRITTVRPPETRDEFRRALQQAAPSPDLAAVAGHPLAAWAELTFGMREQEGRPVRQAPVEFAEGAHRLAAESGLPEGDCAAALRSLLAAGNETKTETGDPVFAFRLHQFLSSGGSVFATIQQPYDRYLTMEGQYHAPGQSAVDRVLYPLAFCRECGQEHYLVSLAAGRLIPRSPLLNATEDDLDGTPGFLTLEVDALWADDPEDLPENWREQRRDGFRIKREYEEHRPVRVWVRPDGSVSDEAADAVIEGWFQPRPLLLCLRCRAAYDKRDSDFRKLATLSQTGRSTATTILAGASIAGLRTQRVEEDWRKILSFTDNRQDTSLQAGHLNDFVQVALVRSAVARAVKERGSLTFDQLGRAVFDALGLAPLDFMKEVAEFGPGYNQARQAMVELLEYRAFEDLRRAWRVALPNLEQTALLRVDYFGLDDLAADESIWRGLPGVADATVEQRGRVLRAFLGHLRSVLAIDAPCLTFDQARQLLARTNQWLREPWAMDQHERLRQGATAILPDASAPNRLDGERLGLGWRSSLGRYLRSHHTWDLDHDLTTDQVEDLLRGIVAALRGHILTVKRHEGADFGVQINAGALLWVPGDGQAPGPDPVRARALYLRRPDKLRSKPNPYFVHLYSEGAQLLTGVTGAEHHGNTKNETRIDREERFRKGELKALFASPTMELGIDLRELAVVHMRNVPRTPANYAQRSGRAGRGGRPALVLTFCSQGNSHDQYFFRQRGRMIAGEVPAGQMDLSNRDLVEAHLHSTWLAFTGLSLGQSMAEVLDIQSPDAPFADGVKGHINLSSDRQVQVVDAFRQAISGDTEAIQSSDWFSAAWLTDAVADAPRVFDAAFDRWRGLYRAAIQQRDEARRRIDAAHGRGRQGQRERDEAERLETEAKREIDLLLNRTDGTETDFYPYRYLATEGFLPGYNFPRLPLRALVQVDNETQAIDRPRFLGLSEFGPWNVIYHEGRKFQAATSILPAGGLAPLLTRAKICQSCGYIHDSEHASVDRCEHCNVELDASNSMYPQSLFQQPTVRGRRWQRISSEEEERLGEGYDITTQYRFADGGRERHVDVLAADSLLLHLTYAPQAKLWRINHGWRRSATRSGFTIDDQTGRWLRREDPANDEDSSAEAVLHRPANGIRPYVTDSRNLLLAQVAEHKDDEQLQLSLLVALQRGIQAVYQVEEQEIALELIGRDDNRRLLFWEAAEGGTGVWERLITEPDSLARVAAEALRICHFDAVTGEPDHDWDSRCALACYDCLLSFSNQRQHRVLSRYAVRDFLMALVGSTLEARAAGRSYDEQYEWLSERVDPASPAERKFLDFLRDQRVRLPDLAQPRPSSEVAAQPDFYYERAGIPGVCVFIDGGVHNTERQAQRDDEARSALRELGFRIIAIRDDRAFDVQVAEDRDVFGGAP